MNRRLRIERFACFLFLGLSATAQPAANDAVRQAMQQGAAAMTSGQFDQAIEAYAGVTHLQPAFAEGFFNLGLAQEQAGHLDEARTALEQAVHLKPSMRGAHLFLGTIAYKRDLYKQAEDDFLAETRIDPRSAKAFMWLGVSRLAGDPGLARLAGDVLGFLALPHRLNPVTRFVSRHLRPRLGRRGGVCRVARHVCLRLGSV